MSSRHGANQPTAQHQLQTYQLLHVAQQDLSQAAFFCDHLLRKGWTREPWEGGWTSYLHQSAYVTAMVVAYCRPFAVSKGQKAKFPTRLLQLEPEEKALHQGLLKLRNQVYAHTDVALRAVRPIRLNNRPTAIEALPPMRFSEEQLKAILRIIRSTSQNIQARLEVLSPSLAPPE